LSKVKRPIKHIIGHIGDDHLLDYHKSGSILFSQ